jgi:pyruvate/2-oxoglutarate dehydrogenase complex dihydrolipoamide acyltransferase (E2) component
MKTFHNKHEIVPFPKSRRMLAATYPAVRRKSMTHALIEVDVTDARKRLREYKERTGEPLSFTAFIIASVARAVDENKLLNACRKGTKQLVLFDTVDVATAIEREMSGWKQPIIHIIQAANTRSVTDIHRDIRAAQIGELKQAWKGLEAEPLLEILPMPVIKILWAIFWWARGRYPGVQTRFGGTVGLTSVGMFGKGGGWALALPYHTLDIAVGGIGEKPGVVDGHIVIREYLHLTLSFDHDIIDGAPAARYTARLRELIEQGYGLPEEA